MSSLLDETVRSLTRTKKGGWVKCSSKVIDKLLDAFLEASHNEASTTEISSLLKEFLWKDYSEGITDNHILVIASALSLIASSNHALSIPSSEDLTSFLTRLLQIYERSHTSPPHKTVIVRALTALVSQVQDPVIRKSTAPMFSILSWTDIEFRPHHDDLDSQFSKAMDKLSSLSGREKVSRLKMASITRLLCLELNKDVPLTLKVEIVNYLCLVLSLLPTRRFLKTVVDQTNACFSLSRDIDKYPKLHYYWDALNYFTSFPVDEFTGQMKSRDQLKEAASTAGTLLQSTLYQKFQDQAGKFLLETSSLSSDLDRTRKELSKIDTAGLVTLLSTLHISTKDQNLDSTTMIDIIISKLNGGMDASEICSTVSALPTDALLIQISECPSDALPSLGPQFLSLSDLLLRSYQQIRADAFTEIYEHVLRTLPRFRIRKKDSKITGSSRHAVQIGNYTITTTKSLTSSENPYSTKIKLDLHSCPQASISEWNDLTEGDVVLLAKIGQNSPKSTNPFVKEGLLSLSSGTIISSLSNSGHIKKDSKSKSFSLHISMDPTQLSHSDKLSAYEDYNLLIKLPPRLKGYKRSLDAISSIIEVNDDVLPEWLLESVLGYGDANCGDWSNFEKKNLMLGKVQRKLLEEALPEFGFNKTKETKKRRVDGGEESTDNLIDAVITDSGISERTIGEGDDLSNLTSAQLRALVRSLHDGLTCASGPPCSGKKTIASKIIAACTSNYPTERILVVSKNLSTLTDVLKGLTDSTSNSVNLSDQLSITASNEADIESLQQTLKLVDNLAISLGDIGAWGNDPNTATTYFRHHIEPRWISFLHSLKTNRTIEHIASTYPFQKFSPLQVTSTTPFTTVLESTMTNYISIKSLFDTITNLAPLSFLTSTKARTTYRISTQARVVGITIDDLLMQASSLNAMNISFSGVLILDAGRMNMLESLFPLMYNSKQRIKRVAMIGDERGLGPDVFNQGSVSESLFQRLIGRGVNVERFNTVFGVDDSFRNVLQKRYGALESGVSVADKNLSLKWSIIKGIETEPHPGFFQNVEEAEAAVEAVAGSLESGIAATDIAIVTPFESQKVLLQEVADSKLNVLPPIETIESLKARKVKHAVISTVRSKAAISDGELTALLSSATESITMVCSEYIKANIG
ncbi:CYFA0S03e02630g1_1 [Cyberlindnera fabianii]|uniref:CYFA0S03e02630g1_1 n=1 Tax=Cyberlindnera fabianii TaxID=36022 RepID=A0A061AXD9_CYBFA|nr:CYFA0S03e02630g1_1 [Cyberlindnera fabianii]